MELERPRSEPGDIDTFQIMHYHNVNPYDIRARHLPPPVAPPPLHASHVVTNASEHDPTNIRDGRTTPAPRRIAPLHLTQAYRTEVDEHGNIRPSHPGPPTRIPNAYPPAPGDFGNGTDFDERAFRAATFRAPPYQLRLGTEYGAGRQGAEESPAAYLRRTMPPPPTITNNPASLPTWQRTETKPTAAQPHPLAPRSTPRPLERSQPGSMTPLPMPALPSAQHSHQSQYLAPHTAAASDAYRPPGAWRNAITMPAGPPVGLLTPAPQGGWRTVQGDNPLWKFGNQNAEQVSAWMNDDAPSCLAHLPGLGATDEGRWVRRGHMESVLHRYFHNDTITVTLPTPSNAQPRRNAAPYFYLVRAEDRRVIQAMVDMIWLSSAELTMGFVRLDLDPPTLVAAFQDIHAFVATTEIGIADLVIDALIAMADITVSLIIEDIANNGRWQSFSALEAFDHILHSVRVRIIHRRIRGDIIDPIVLIYCQSPTADAGGWEAFRHHIQNYPFGSTHSGHPTPITTSLWCALCHSHDHPTGLCYLPTVPMWHGPSIEEVLAVQAAPPPPSASTNSTRGTPRPAGRGARRGRGRGGR